MYHIRLKRPIINNTLLNAMLATSEDLLCYTQVQSYHSQLDLCHKDITFYVKVL